MYVSGPVEMSHWTPATEISPSSSTLPVLRDTDNIHLVKMKVKPMKGSDKFMP